MFSVTHPRFGARFEQVEETAVLQQELLGAERKRSLAGRRVRCRFDRGDNGNFVGKSGSRRVETGPSRCAVEQAADRPPVADQGRGRTEGTPTTFRACEDFERIALRVERSLRLDRSGSARHGSHGRRQPDEEQPLALEAFGGAGQPVADGSVRGSAAGDLDEAWVTAVQAAEQVHRVGEVARGITTGCVEEGR